MATPLIRIGLTGSLASGKTSAARSFKKCGCAVFDADEVARKLLAKESPVYRRFCRKFGSAYLKPDGSVNRAKVAEAVFGRPALRRQLTRMIHPEVLRRAEAFVVRCRKSGVRAAVLDAPLLFESGMDRMTDVTVVVSSDLKRIFSRVRRRGISLSLAKKILKTQWPDARKRKRADFVVRNSGTLKQLNKIIKEVFQAILKSA